MSYKRWVLPSIISLSTLSAVAQTNTAWIEENFSSNPLSGSWRLFGESSLFHWNEANQNLEVTWDSSYSNSYFYWPLPASLTSGHDFSFSADLTLQDIAAGVDPENPFSFEIAFGLMNWNDATNGSFLRGTGADSPNLVEFTFFPDTGYGPTISPVIITASNQWAAGWMIQDLDVNNLFHIEMDYAASNHVLTCNVTRNGQPYASGATSAWGTDYADFHVDTFSISSYNDAQSGGSILAHGTMDNIRLEVALPRITGTLTNNVYTARFITRPGFFYGLEGSSDLHAWSTLSYADGDGKMLTMQHTNSLPHYFYRVGEYSPQ